jgi:hypothetical protein
MAVSSTYYLNAPSLGSATAVFSNAALTTLAADGFYSDGTIAREQVSGVLLPQQTCPSCATPCGETINANGQQGIYLLNVDTGTTVSDVGAIVITFNPYSIPDGIRAIFGNNVYNAVSSPIDGFHQSATGGNFTFIGNVNADCGISGTTYPALDEFLYNGTSFVATGNTQSVSVAAGDVSLSTNVNAPGNTVMVIPKLTPSPSVINFEVVGPCSGTAWDMSVACPVLLTGFSSSVMASTEEQVCALSETTTYYNVSLAGTPGTVGLYDYVFADAYGATPLATGLYKATGSITGGNDWFQVGSDGIVIMLGTCTTPPPVSYNCVSGNCVDPGDGTGTYSTLQACQAVCSAPPVSAWYELSKCSDSSVLYSEEYTQGDFAVNERVTIPGSIICIVVSELSSAPVGTLYAITTTGLTGCPPVESYSCDGFCYDPGDGSGPYATLQECEAACGAPATADVNYSFTLENGAAGQFDLYVNGVIQQTRTTTSTGTWSVNEGDIINVEVSTTGCSGSNGVATSYTSGILNQSSCTGINTATLFTTGYTVTNADLGTILTVNAFSHCDTGCV